MAGVWVRVAFLLPLSDVILRVRCVVTKFYGNEVLPITLKQPYCCTHAQPLLRLCLYHMLALLRPKLLLPKI